MDCVLYVTTSGCAQFNSIIRKGQEAYACVTEGPKCPQYNADIAGDLENSATPQYTSGNPVPWQDVGSASSDIVEGLATDDWAFSILEVATDILGVLLGI